MPNKWTSSGILSALIVLVSACAPASVPPINPIGSAGNGNSNGQLGSGPCSVTTPDSDQDGLSDECEKQLGMNPFDKDSDQNNINDDLDCPPSDPTCSTVPQDRKNDALKKLATPLLLGAGGMTGVPSAGTTTTITEHEIRISSGSAALPSEKSLCTGPNYLYLRITGTVNTCKLLPETCGLGDQRTELELCADTTSVASKTDFENTSSSGQKISLSSIQWNKGRIYGTELFNPSLLNKDKTSGSFNVSFEVSTAGNVSGCVAKINSDWESSLKIQGEIRDASGNGQPVDVVVSKINKKWERYSGFNCDTTTLKGLTGPWKVR